MGLIEGIVQFLQNNFLISLVGIFFLVRLLFSKGNSGPIEEYPGNKVISIHSEEDWKKNIEDAAKHKKLVVVDFFATWCGPCRFAAPVYGKMSTEIEDVVFLKVDVDEMKTIALENHVRAMPTFVVYKRGGKVDSMTGWSERNLRNLISKHQSS